MTEKPTVMFVDDEERILRSLSMLFRTRYTVITCNSGHEALRIMQRVKVHVLVSDQRMPEMMGVDLLRKSREISPSTIRILLTGYSDLVAIVGSINQGEVFRYIQKPWQADQILATVTEAMAIALATDAEEAIAQADIDTVVTGSQILVIDSDREVLEQVTMAAEGINPVRHVDNLEKALDIIAREDVAVVVSEASLGGTDLTTALKTIKRFNPGIVTIVMTSFSDTGVLVDLINQGQIFRFLPKPIRRGLLEISLRAALRRHNALKKSPKLLSRHQVAETGSVSDAGVGERIKRMLKNLRERRDMANSLRH